MLATSVRRARRSGWRRRARRARLPTRARSTASPSASSARRVSHAQAVRRGRQRAALATLPTRAVAPSVRRARVAHTSLRRTRRGARLVSAAHSAQSVCPLHSHAPGAPTRTPPTCRRQSSASSARLARAVPQGAWHRQHARQAASRRFGAPPSARRARPDPFAPSQMARNVRRALPGHSAPWGHQPRSRARLARTRILRSRRR